MKTLYIDAFSGVSGDKFVAALLDLTHDFDYLSAQIKTLGIEDEYEITLSKKNVLGIDSGYFKVNLANEKKHSHGEKDASTYKHTHENNLEHSHAAKNMTEHSHSHRNLSDISKIIKNSKISEKAKEAALGIFKIVAEAEAKVHGKNIEEVHFHEVGAVDSIIDIVSTAVLLDALNPDKILCSHIPTGSGFVKMAHGVFPIPAPATLEILKGIPIYAGKVCDETTTPTGAAIVKYFVTEFTDAPLMTIEKTGYGAGTKNFDIPNTLRISLGETTENDAEDKIIKLETNLDDQSPEQTGFLFELLLKNNALDVFLTPIIMKKNRPAVILTVLCKENDVKSIEKIIFKNSSTFGIRKSERKRTILQRDIKRININGVEIKIKNGYYEGKLIKEEPEYEDVKKLCQTLSIGYMEARKLIFQESYN